MRPTKKFRAEKTVYFVRHGESEGNTRPVFQALDTPLSSRGKKQAELIADRAEKLAFTTLVASPLMRSRETAEAIARRTGKTPEYSDLFVERIKPARLVGKSFTNPRALVLWRKWEQSLYTPGMRVEDGENFDDLIARTDAALEYLRTRPERELLVVTHGFFLRAMFARVLLGEALTGGALKHFLLRSATKNTGLSVLARNHHLDGSQWRVLVFNDHAHLA
jgi:broad specificity phosphatase PhoE